MSQQDGTYMYQAPVPKTVIAYYIAQPFGDPVPVTPQPFTFPVSQEGWACPRCQRIYGPQVTECRHCNNKIEDASKPVRKDGETPEVVTP